MTTENEKDESQYPCFYLAPKPRTWWNLLTAVGRGERRRGEEGCCSTLNVSFFTCAVLVIPADKRAKHEAYPKIHYSMGIL